MNAKSLHHLFLFLVLINLSACKDIIEPSIAKRSVNLFAPGERYQSKNYTVTFWWDEVEDALQYRLQIVTPKFDTIGALIADTLVKANKLTLSLSPGEYQFRVRAENGSSQTAYSAPHNFSVVFSSIKQQSVQLVSPGNNALTNKGTTNFQWGTMFGAKTYRLQIDTNNFSDASKIIYDNTSPGQQYTYTFPKDQQYQWRVRAENDTAQSLWSAIRNIRFDRTAPAQVTLASPGKGEVVPLPVSLQWNAITTASIYKVYVLKSDSTSNYDTTFPVSVNSTSYSFNLGNTGDRIYWKVSAIDAAGNEGPESELRSFVIK
ncbi:hypothetical protein A0256_20900 [Mucilaginibacter sp. PAMC 26640]|nr:hypothetical protein A0256_20900 [Mucilaginibacter sp. PAMC 26640]